MISEERKNQILQFKKEGKSWKEIGAYFRMTSSAAQQASKSLSFIKCLKHFKFYKYSCRFCSDEEQIKDFFKNLSNLKPEEIEKEIQECAVKKRNKELVFRRMWLIKELKNKYNLSEIGRMVNRHHTTISYLYKKCQELEI